MQSLRPKKPSKLHYFQLSREFNARWLICGEYRKLLWYWEKYEKINKFGKFDEKLIKIKQK